LAIFLVVDLSVTIVVFVVTDFVLWKCVLLAQAPLPIFAFLGAVLALAFFARFWGATVAILLDRISRVFDIVYFAIAIVVFPVAFFGLGSDGSFAL
jgi:hypothetical protein